MVMAALLLPVMMGLCAFALDVGTMYAQRRSLQNAADAGALAGARELQQQQLGLPADPATKAQLFAARNGVSLAGGSCQSDGQPTVYANYPTMGSTPTAAPVWQVSTSRLVPLTFGSFVGRPQQCVQATAKASSAAPMMDIMLSLDTTGSMALAAGDHDFTQLRNAVTEFITQVKPDASNPMTNRIGLARFAGIQCGYDNSGNYKLNCKDDKTVVTRLTDNQQHLLDLVNGGGPTCSNADKTIACPIRHLDYAAPGGDGSSPKYTGTKLPNAFTVVNNTSAGFYAWTNTAAYGGRVDAHKALVMLTDGQNEAWPIPTGEDVSTYDNLTRQRAIETKNGPDGIAGTADDVEVFVIGYFCTPYTPNQNPPQSFCKSALADTPLSTRPCPNGAWPPAVTPSAVDTLLHDISSSTPNTCDHYFPLKKSEDLPQIMRALTARFAGIRLME
jgi:Flp pilus assembly protein TadG